MNEIAALLALVKLQEDGKVVLKGLIPDEDMDLLENWMLKEYPDEEKHIELVIQSMLEVLKSKIKELKGE